MNTGIFMSPAAVHA